MMVLAATSSVSLVPVSSAGNRVAFLAVANIGLKLIVNKTVISGARHIWGVGVSSDGIREGATTNDPMRIHGLRFL